MFKQFGVKLISASMLSLSLLFGALGTTAFAASSTSSSPQAVFISRSPVQTFDQTINNKAMIQARQATVAAERARLMSTVRPSGKGVVIVGERVFYGRNSAFLPNKRHVLMDLSEFPFPGVTVMPDSNP